MLRKVMLATAAAALLGGCTPLFEVLNSVSDQPCLESGVHATVMGGSAGPGGALGDRVVCTDLAEKPWPTSSLKQPTADEQRALLIKHGIPLPEAR
jgi:hypothetical protein